MRTFALCLLALLSFCLPAAAENLEPTADFLTLRPVRDPWRINWRSIDTAPAPAYGLVLAETLTQDPNQPNQQPLHPVAIQHSDAYQTRAKIHKYASFATLPLFAGELALGQSLFNSPDNRGGKRGLHAAVGAGIIGLFGLNTVTGSWNLFGEGWEEKDGRTLRLVHGLLMMAAGGGFVGTWATAPHSRRFGTSANFESDKRLHRNIAVASISVGTAGYLIMLLANH